ncbi:diguanylate cyclase/phosphodiesterase 1 domain protein, partial [Vibrio harveyi]
NPVQHYSRQLRAAATFRGQQHH